MVSLLALAVPALQAADGTILWQGNGWSGYRWDEHLAWYDRQDLFLGFSDQPMPAVNGVGFSTAGGIRTGSTGESSFAPLAGPVWRGATIEFTPGMDAIGSWAFMSLTPTLRLQPGIATGDVPNGDPRQIWSGLNPFPEQQQATLIPGGTVGVVGLRHVLSASAAPVFWGPAIFGGVVLGGGERGFPHAQLTTSRPWELFDIADDPLLLRYSAIVGQLDGDRLGPEHPLLVGSRLGLRWAVWEAGLSMARVGGGSGSSLPGWAWSPIWSVPTVAHAAVVDQTSALDLACDLAQAIRFGVEYGISQPLPEDSRGSLLGAMGVAAAAWTATLDWYDVLGDGSLRLATEFHSSEAGVYASAFSPDGWTYRDQPLGHSDGDDARSIRLLTSIRSGDDADVNVVVGVRQRGWRNQHADNPNTALPDAGGLPLPPVEWTTWSLDLSWSGTWRDWTASLLVGGSIEKNALFVESSSHAEGVTGLSFIRRY